MVRRNAYSVEEMDSLGSRAEALIRQVKESNVLTPEQKQGILKSNELSEEEINRFGESARIHSIFRIHLFSQLFRDYIREPRKLDVAADLLGEDLFCPNDLYFFKAPGVGRPICWHQDSWYFRNIYETPDGESIEDVSIGTWLAIDEATRENGCLWVIPGSHKRGVVEHSENEEKQFLKFEADIAGQIKKDAVPVEVPKGALIFFNNALLHSSTHNLSDRRRRAYIVHFMKATVHHTERGRNQVWATRLRLGIPEAYICGQRFPECVQTPDDEECLNWDNAIGKPMTQEDLILPSVCPLGDAGAQPQQIRHVPEHKKPGHQQIRSTARPQ